MKVVVLTSDTPNQVALCQKLAEVVSIEAIVVSENIPRRAPPRPVRRLVNRVETRLVGARLVSAWRSLQVRYHERWPRFPDVPRVDVRNINDAATERVLEQHAPELVLVSGTNLVGKKLIAQAQRGRGMLNLHTGLSPYVKGGPNCTNWCLAENALHLIGNTVMWIDPGIDSGALVLTEQTPLTGHESLSGLHFGVMEHAHDIYVRAVRAVVEGHRLPRVSQDAIGPGQTFYTVGWTGRHVLRAQLNFLRTYGPAYFQGSEHRRRSAALQLVSLADGSVT